MRPHPDLDLLALRALGEPVLGEEGETHLAGCGRCRSTVTELAATVAAARVVAVDEAVDPAGAADAVPAHVWQGIAGELGLDPAIRPASVGPTSIRAVPPQPLRLPALVDPPAALPAAAVPAAAVAAPLPVDVAAVTSRRGRRVGPRLLGVAAAGLVVGVAGTALVTALSGGDDSRLEPQQIAAADLEAYGAGAGTAVTGSARLAGPAGQADDDRVLQVWLDGVPDTGEAFLEAWLIDPDSGAMVSLGPLASQDRGAVTVELSVPPGLDVADYAVVDVSAEPLDGDPTHSGTSLARGTLAG